VLVWTAAVTVRSLSRRSGNNLFIDWEGAADNWRYDHNRHRFFISTQQQYRQLGEGSRHAAGLASGEPFIDDRADCSAQLVAALARRVKRSIAAL
jgi:hypothetical protein